MTEKHPAVWKTLPGRGREQIVLFNWKGRPPKFRNLARVGEDGQTIWLVEPSHPLEGVYSDAAYDQGVLTAYNMMSGTSDTIDYETGRVTKRQFVK